MGRERRNDSQEKAGHLTSAEKVKIRRPAPKGAVDFEALAVSLKRYPDTKLSFRTANWTTVSSSMRTSPAHPGSRKPRTARQPSAQLRHSSPKLQRLTALAPASCSRTSGRPPSPCRKRAPQTGAGIPCRRTQKWASTGSPKKIAEFRLESSFYLKSNCGASANQ